MDPLLGYSNGPPESKVPRSLGLTLTLGATIFLIVAVVTPAMYHTTIDGMLTTADVGPFIAVMSINIPGDAYTMSCRIDSSCQCQFTRNGQDLPQYQVADSCGTWNWARGLMIHAIIIAFLGLIFQLLSFYTLKPRVRSLAFSFPLSASTFGLVSMALYVYENQNDANIQQTQGETVTYNYGFGLLVCSWIILAAGGIMFGFRRRMNGAYI